MLPIRPSIMDTIRTQRSCNFIVFAQPDPVAHPLEYCFRSIVPPFSLTGPVPLPPRFANVLSCSVTLLSHLLATYLQLDHAPCSILFRSSFLLWPCQSVSDSCHVRTCISPFRT